MFDDVCVVSHNAISGNHCTNCFRPAEVTFWKSFCQPGLWSSESTSFTNFRQETSNSKLMTASSGQIDVQTDWCVGMWKMNTLLLLLLMIIFRSVRAIQVKSHMPSSRGLKCFHWLRYISKCIRIQRGTFLHGRVRLSMFWDSQASVSAHAQPLIKTYPLLSWSHNWTGQEVYWHKMHQHAVRAQLLVSTCFITFLHVPG